MVLASVGAAAVLTVGASAGIPAVRMATVQRAPAAPLGATALGAPAASSTQSGFIVLRPRDEKALQAFIAAVAKPHSSEYHHYLKPDEFAGRFGPTSSTIAAVRSQLTADGLQVTSVARDGLLVGFSGTTANVESAFGTRLERYRSAAGITGEQTTKPVSLPSSISADVAGVVGLNTLVHPRASLVRPPRSAYAGRAAAKTAQFTHYSGAPNPCSDATNAAGVSGGLTDDQIANAYGATPLYGAGDTGSGVHIGVYELEPFSSQDLQTFDECYFGTTQGDAMAASVNTVAVDGGQPSGAGSGESILDIEDVSAIAPGATIDVYEAPNTTAGSLDEYAAMVNADQDQLITSSWGLCEQDLQQADPGGQQAENYIFQQAAAQGQTVLSAAGDTGDDTCNEVRAVPPPTDQNPLSVEDPASQPYVLAVGGTTIQDADPSHYGETVWNDGAAWGGTGGGISASWQAPAWQQATSYLSGGHYASDLGNANAFETAATQPPLGIADGILTPGFCANNGIAGFSSSTPCRTLPDVSAQADEFTGAVTMYQASGGGWFTIGGTSSATPIWAALLALVDQSSACTSASATVGFASPLLYGVAGNVSEYADSFHDITSGNNDVFGFQDGTVFPARTGYDLASGLGSPILAHSDSTPGLAQNLCDLAAGTTARPAVTGLSSLVGDVSGGGSLTVTGTGFSPGSGVTVKSVSVGADVIGAADIGSVSNTSLTFTLPPATATLAPQQDTATDPDTGMTYPAGGSVGGQDGAGLANIVVTLSNGVSSPVYANDTVHSLYDQYTYADENAGSPVPSVSSISPYAGVNTGGTRITIYGSGFAAGDTVTVGGVAATGVNVVSPWEIQATTAAYDSSNCMTETALENELSTSAHQWATNICQTDVVVTDSGSHASAVTAPQPTYLGLLPSANQDGLLEVPVGYELAPVPDEFDYVPAPTLASIGAGSTDGNANADPGSFGQPTQLSLNGTGLNYQTLNWFSFGDPTQASSQDTTFPEFADGNNVGMLAPADPNGVPAAGSDPDPVGVTVTTMGGQSSYNAACSGLSPICVDYSGIPVISSVAANGSGAASDAGGSDVVISGSGLGDVTGPLQFIDHYTLAQGVPPFSNATQYQYTVASDTEIDTKTVEQNPAVVDTFACSDSGCSAQSASDELLLYPPGDPVITSIQTSSGPPEGGTLVTINGENLGCVTGVNFGGVSAEAFGNIAALLDCGSSTQAVVVAPPGTAGRSVPITLTTVESDLTGAPAASSLSATSGPTEFTYDSADPSVTNAVAFGSVNLASTSGPAPVTLTNPASATQPLYPEPAGPSSGGSPTTIGASILGGSGHDFSITGDSCSGAALAPGQSCSLEVQFAPSALGARSATLDIPFNYSSTVAAAYGLPSQTSDLTVALSGTGAEPTTTSTVTTPGTTTVVTKKVTCTVTVRWRWVKVKVHGKKRRKHKKFVTRSKGCKALAKKAAKPSRKHGRRDPVARRRVARQTRRRRG